jgi:metal-dependent hydrolase (beta-lactamase superfamily II)
MNCGACGLVMTSMHEDEGACIEALRDVIAELRQQIGGFPVLESEHQAVRAENVRLRAALLVVAQHCTDIEAKTYALNAWRRSPSESSATTEGDPR